MFKKAVVSRDVMFHEDMTLDYWKTYYRVSEPNGSLCILRSHDPLGLFEEHSSELVAHAPPLSGGVSTGGGVNVPVFASHERHSIS